LSISRGYEPLLDRETYGGGYNSRYVTDLYEGHIVRVFLRSGDTRTPAMSEERAVLGIEKALADASSKRAESTDPDHRYHILPLADLEKLAPDFDFSAYFSRVAARPVETVNVANPDYVKAVNQLIDSVPVDSWKSYFRWQILNRQALALPKTFHEEDWAFWDAQVGVQEQPAPRWKQCTSITDQVFGDALAREWVKRHFSPAAKAGTERLVDALDKALADEIHTLPWMSEETKRTAEAKLAAIRNRIGHPQKWRDYSALQVDRHDFLADLHRDAVFERNYMLSKLGGPVDPDQWDTLPTALKAQFDRSSNSLYLPAGAIEPPFFDSGADPAVNFGGIGVLTAHELIHGFDALGSKYDEHGNAREWWTPNDRKQFVEATNCEVTRVREAVPQSDDAPRGLNSLPVDESAAYDGGLRIAFRALLETLGAQGRSADNKSGGYTESQRFFLAFAQSSCENQTFLTARRSQSIDPYSVGHVRVNGGVQNFEEFGQAFQCAKGKLLYPEKSCRVW
jgi:putative endopeptidase